MAARSRAIAAASRKAIERSRTRIERITRLIVKTHSLPTFHLIARSLRSSAPTPSTPVPGRPISARSIARSGPDRGCGSTRPRCSGRSRGSTASSPRSPQEWRRPNGGSLIAAREYRSDGALPHSRLFETVLNEAGAAYLVVDDSGTVVLANAAARQLVSVGEADIGRPFQDLPISYRPLQLMRRDGDLIWRHGRITLTDPQALAAAIGRVKVTVSGAP